MNENECKVDGETYIAEDGPNYLGCTGCAGRHDGRLCVELGRCSELNRADGRDIIWVKVE